MSRPVPLAQALSLDTLPALRQEVHTFRRLLVPLTMARTDWLFGFQRREWRRCEWDTVLPNLGPLAQMSQDRKSTRLNSSHVAISYAGFGLENKRSCGC